MPGMVFMVVAATAPLTAMASNLSLSLGLGAGEGTLGWILLIGVLLVFFTAGYIALARTVVSAGAYHVFVRHGLGPSAGGAAAFVATIAYNLACAGMIAATGYFTDQALTTYAGIDLPWAVYSVVALAVVWLLGFFGAGLASKVATVVSLLQFVLLAVLAIAVLGRDPGQFATDGFTPGSVTSGGAALTVVFVLLSFAGYEAAATYGEECNAPGKKIKYATYLALGLLVLVFLISTWTLVAAYDDVQAAAAPDPGAVLGGAAEHYLGRYAGGLISVTVALSFLAAAVAFHNMAARYGFALGRAGLLPRVLGRTHRVRATPHIAVGIQVAIDVLVLVPFVVGGADPLTTVFPSISGVTSLSLIFLMVSCALSAVVSSVRGTLNGAGLGTRTLSLIACAGLLAVGALIVLNYGQVTGSSSPAVAAMPALIVLGAVAGALAGRRRSTGLQDA
ncbi:APC family permease [Amycolatopsis ultiminotia]|uniref:APC family permease n=1 Tax=Amycolatopsis ultiminotia TaxID=543629 RepID=A0ABP6XX33_9PSEU